MSFFQTKSFEALFLPQNHQKGGGLEQIQKFWGSFEEVLVQFWCSFYCNISSISVKNLQ